MENPYINVVCAIILKNNQVLAVKRSETQHLAGYWEFPGGKVDPHESEKNAIIREIEEELQVLVQPIMSLTSIWWQDQKELIRLKPIVCELREGEIKLQEHEAYKWLDHHEFSNLNWAPADVILLNQVRELMARF